jgi:hypothetical protein
MFLSLFSLEVEVEVKLVFVGQPLMDPSVQYSTVL